jgi:hypothetical protein
VIYDDDEWGDALAAMEAVRPGRAKRWPLTAAEMAAALGGYGTWASGYQLDQASGAAADSFGAINLTPASTPQFQQTGAIVGSPIIDYAVGFNSAGDRFDAASAASYDITTVGQLAFYVCWKAGGAVGNHVFNKLAGSVFYALNVNASGHLQWHVHDGSVIRTATIAINHADGNYHDILCIIDRTAQRTDAISDLGASASVDITTSLTFTNAGVLSLGGTDANINSTCAFFAVANADALALKTNATAAIAAIRSYTGRA